MSEKSYKRVAAVSTAINVLKHLAEQREPVSGQQIAEALGAPYGTVMCHLVTLNEHRFVRQIGDAWELDMGIGVIWARYKAQLEGKIEALSSQLRLLEIQGG